MCDNFPRISAIKAFLRRK